MRIALHDYAGHPFQFELSRALARRGHVVRHYFFADDIGPKGSAQLGRDDPQTLSIEPVVVPLSYSKTNLLQRFSGDIRYGRIAAARIASFGPDIVISGNTPLDAQGRLVESAHRSGAAFVFWMQDFHSLAVERFIGERWRGLGRLVADRYLRLERRLLGASDGVVLISDTFRDALARLGAPAGNVSVIPNWGALERIPVRQKANAWAARHGLSDKFVFLYAGTLALKHNPERLWSLAEAFEHDENVVVAVAATGISVDLLRDRQRLSQQKNLMFLPLQPFQDFPDMLGAADVVLALLGTDAGEFSVPSKVLSYMCASRPILLSAPKSNQAARIVDQAGAGIVVDAVAEADYLDAARQLRGDPQLRRRLGDAGRAYSEQTFDIERVTDQFEHVFARALNTRNQARRGRTSSSRHGGQLQPDGRAAGAVAASASRAATFTFPQDSGGEP